MSHTNDVCDGTFRSNDAADSCVWRLLTELLEQDQDKLAQQLVFATLLDHNSETGLEIGSLLDDRNSPQMAETALAAFLSQVGP